MKNTVQAHRNGGTKSAAVQPPTSRRQPVKPTPAPANAAGQTIAAFVDTTNNPAESGHFVLGAIDEMTLAKAQSAAMHMLLLDVLGAQEYGVYGEEIQLGISELILTTHTRMDLAVEAIEALVASKREVAS